ncbi:hypothetical protein C9F11_37540 [Streptomyces sp. YIM 121038]|nr:hypothetical protein C9F11_37540 [Streptomyces sp. YIM 121038]
MIGEAIETALVLLRALFWWVIGLAAAAALLFAALTAAVAWAWNAVRSGPRRPSWARGRLQARIHARHRTRAPDGRSGPRRPTRTRSQP